MRYMILKIYLQNFNPHSRTGSDCVATSLPVWSPDFNPHSRTGSDSYPDVKYMVLDISIHTPARGVT